MKGDPGDCKRCGHSRPRHDGRGCEGCWCPGYTCWLLPRADDWRSGFRAGRPWPASPRTPDLERSA